MDASAHFRIKSVSGNTSVSQISRRLMSSADQEPIPLVSKGLRNAADFDCRKMSRAAHDAPAQVADRFAARNHRPHRVEIRHTRVRASEICRYYTRRGSTTSSPSLLTTGRSNSLLLQNQDKLPQDRTVPRVSQTGPSRAPASNREGTGTSWQAANIRGEALFR